MFVNNTVVDVEFMRPINMTEHDYEYWVNTYRIDG